MRACPSCGRLVHADRLAALAQSARAATDRNDPVAALTAWREALDLLPRGSKQHEVISAKLTELGRDLPANALPVEQSGQTNAALRVATGVGAVGLLVWKFKALFFGLTKGTTLFSMLLSLGVYWTAWGWQFALGIVLSIYVHEMGHVIALRRYGFKASAPMFIPGLGALIRLQQHVVNPREDAEIGLAGPIYGMFAALFSLVLWLATALPIFAAIAAVGAWINLFNLMPIGSLDGGRAFHAMSHREKFIVAAVVGIAWFYTEDGVLLLVGLICIGRAFGDKQTAEGSRKTVLTYCMLVAVLSAITLLRSKTGIPY